MARGGNDTAEWLSPVVGLVGAYAGSAVRGWWHRRKAERQSLAKLSDNVDSLTRAIAGEAATPIADRRPGLLELVHDVAGEVSATSSWRHDHDAHHERNDAKWRSP